MRLEFIHFQFCGVFDCMNVLSLSHSAIGGHLRVGLLCHKVCKNRPRLFSKVFQFNAPSGTVGGSSCPTSWSLFDKLFNFC